MRWETEKSYAELSLFRNHFYVVEEITERNENPLLKKITMMAYKHLARVVELNSNTFVCDDDGRISKTPLTYKLH